MEENFFQEIKKKDDLFFLSPENSTSEQYRRLSNNDVLLILEYISGMPKCVRSFLTFAREDVFVEPKSILKISKLLRVLQIQSHVLTNFPVDLCNLALLKYIAISSHFSSLPSSFSTLFNLQTLIVNTTSPTLEIKADIWKMPQFRHLHTKASTSLPSPSTKNQKSKQEASSAGKNVQTLSIISPESCKKEVFDRTPNLKKLGIGGTITKLFEVSGGESRLFGHLSRLECLKNLKLLNDDVNSKLESLPSEKSFPKQLTMLTLLNTLLDWEEMAKVGNLENLEVLKLKDFAFQGKLWRTENGGFRRLKHLHIGRTDLEVCESSADHFPKLARLQLNGCDMLHGIPLGFADIPSLQLVVLHCTNPRVANSARKLQLLKLEQAATMGNKNSFKLSVYPPEH